MLIGIGVVFHVHRAAAQQTTPVDSLPFRAGQWAAQFTASSEHRNAGLLRFRTPRKAWVFTADMNFGASSSGQSALDPVDDTTRTGKNVCQPARRTSHVSSADDHGRQLRHTGNTRRRLPIEPER